MASPGSDQPQLVAEVPGLGEASVPLWVSTCAEVRRAYEGLARGFDPERLSLVVWSVRPPRQR